MIMNIRDTYHGQTQWLNIVFTRSIKFICDIFTMTSRIFMIVFSFRRSYPRFHIKERPVSNVFWRDLDIVEIRTITRSRQNGRIMCICDRTYFAGWWPAFFQFSQNTQMKYMYLWGSSRKRQVFPSVENTHLLWGCSFCHSCWSGRDDPGSVTPPPLSILPWGCKYMQHAHQIYPHYAGTFKHRNN